MESSYYQTSKDRIDFNVRGRELVGTIFLITAGELRIIY